MHRKRANSKEISANLKRSFNSVTSFILRLRSLLIRLCLIKGLLASNVVLRLSIWVDKLLKALLIRVYSFSFNCTSEFSYENDGRMLEIICRRGIYMFLVRAFDVKKPTQSTSRQIMS